jgi:hypothetical protein
VRVLECTFWGRGGSVGGDGKKGSNKSVRPCEFSVCVCVLCVCMCVYASGKRGYIEVHN